LFPGASKFSEVLTASCSGALSRGEEESSQFQPHLFPAALAPKVRIGMPSYNPVGVHVFGQLPDYLGLSLLLLLRESQSDDHRI